MSHTEGRLHYQEESDAYTHIARDEHGKYVFAAPQGSGGTNEADARRLVACWNRLFLIPTESIESDDYMLVNSTEFSLLLKERYELVKMLRAAADYLHDLIGAWAWKEGEIAGNAKEYDDLVNAEKAARAILSRYPEES